MINGLSIDVEDWFQVENLRAVCPYDKWDKYDLRVENNTDRILELLAKHNTKATFFILGWVAERVPGLVEKIAVEGHEVASHGYKHELVYDLLPAEFEDDIVKSKSILEKLTKQKVIGYRAPSFSITEKSIWATDILVKHGFKYDSSVFPTSFHNRYGFKDSKTYAYSFSNGLKEFPLATYKMGKFNLPLAGGGYFRLAPYGVLKYFLKKINKEPRFFIFYLHPWEIDPGQPRVNIKYTYKFRHYVNLDKTYERLNRLLQDFEFDRIDSLL